MRIVAGVVECDEDSGRSGGGVMRIVAGVVV